MNTIILTWRPSISSFTHSRFETFIIEFYDDSDMNWSVWEHEKAKRGDRFFLVKVGEDETGVVASGYFSSNPYRGDDWSGKGRIVYYMDIDIDHLFNPWKTPILPTDVLNRYIPDFKWDGGHSGRLMSVTDSRKLERLWARFLNSQPDDIYSASTDLARHRHTRFDAPKIRDFRPMVSSVVCDTRLLLNTKAAVYHAISKSEWHIPITFDFKQPQDGWMPVKIKSARNKIEVELSDVYDPLTKLREWLETIASDRTIDFGVDCVTDNEYSHTLFHYEDISFWPEKLGLLYIIDTWTPNDKCKKLPSVYTVLTRKEIVKSIYIPLLEILTSIKDEENAREYMMDWGKSDGDCNDWQEVIDMFKSEKIECFLDADGIVIDPVLASFRGDLDSLKYIAKSRDLSGYFIEGFWGTLKFPLWAVPKSLLYIIGDPKTWREPYKNVLTRIKPKLEAMIAWWNEAMGIDADKDIPYGIFYDCFFAAAPEDTPEDILWEENIEELIKNADCTSADVELYCAAVKFDYLEVKRLLDEGANPNAKLLDGEDIKNRITVEASFLGSEWDNRWLEILSINGKIENLSRFMPNFIGYAAHERMYDLLKKYSKEDN